MVEKDFDVVSMTDRKVWRANRVCVGDIVERTIWSFPDKEAGRHFRNQTYSNRQGVAERVELSSIK